MLSLLKKYNRLNETVFLGLLSSLCLSLSIIRILYTGKGTYLFLNWNLFLASIPWIISTILIIKPKFRNNIFILTGLFLLWIVFFPNAPYILTDLFHLEIKTEIAGWYDLILILSYAWTGLFYGFMSLWDLEFIFRQSVIKEYIPVFSTCILFLSSFGVYIGRYLRWNSWDIISNPYKLFYTIGDRIFNIGTWAMTFCMGIFLMMIYWSLRWIRVRKH